MRGKDLSALNLLCLVVGCVVGMGAFTMPGTTFLPQAGPAGTALGLGIGAALMALIAQVVGYASATSEAGDGIYGSVRATLGDNHAFVCGWCQVLVYISLVALNATALQELGHMLPVDVLGFGPSYQVAGVEVRLTEAALCVGVLGIVASLVVRGVCLERLVQTILVALLLAGVATIRVAGRAQGAVELLGHQPAFYPGRGAMQEVLSVIAMSPWAFVGFESITLLAHETRVSARAMRRVMVGGIVLGACVYMALAVLATSAHPTGAESWVEYVDVLDTHEGVFSNPVFYLAHLVLPNGVGVGVMAISAVGAALSGVVGFDVAAVRLVARLGEVEALPAWLGRRDERHGTPANAQLFVLAIAVAGCLLGRNALTWIVDMSSVGAAVVYGYASVAALRLARRRQERSRETLAWTSLALSGAFLALLVLPPWSIGGRLGLESYVCLITWVALGVNFFTPSLGSAE